MLAAHTKLGCGKQAVNDVVILPHTIVDELTIAFGPDDKQRRRFSLCDSGRHLDVDFGAVIERRDWSSGRVIALDRIAEPQP